jgi:protein-L-isoaspartate(D-aspartate) O-methyltransferase
MNVEDALRAVPRRMFVPDTIWIRRDDMWMVPLRRQDEPEEWARLVARDDEPVITQVDDGAVDKGLRPTSSSSAPTVMATMIKALDVAPGARVLEIGTGTGYNAAVLAAMAGTQVISIEVDADVAAHARRAVREAGAHVTVVTGDGALGHSEHAPYDRVVATASVRDVPYAWIEQTRAGGRVIAPWSNDLAWGEPLLTLTVKDDDTADGKFGEDLSFMRLRAQRPREVWWGEDDANGDYVQSTTRVDPREVFDDDNARFAIGARLHGFTDGRTRNSDDSETYRLSHHPSGSWAGFTPGDGEHQVRQHGPRRLWDEFEDAYTWWLTSNRPGPARFGMTITPKHQHIWLDSPAHPIDHTPE